MPIYEARGFRTRGNSRIFTKEQKLDAHAALFGISNPTMTTTSNGLTSSEIERMRELVLMHDVSNRNESKEFDLNDPPKKQYLHQPFPTTVYHHAKGKNRLAHNEEELAEALAHGWQRKPFVPPVAPPVAESFADDDDDEGTSTPPPAARAAAAPKTKRAAK
jgi:hypothetical protein